MLGVNSEALKELIISNRSLIVEMASMTESINATDNILLSNQISSYGSNMTPEELMKDIKHNGESFDNYGDFLESVKKDIKLDEEDYKEYVKSIDAEYVEAKDGKVYYKEEGAEESKSVDISTIEGIEANKLAGEEIYD
jgi:predicted translin family RNA/ssDNA-binding protein